jgi:hypothetical protein
MNAIEERFGLYCEPIDIETRQFQKQPCYPSVIEVEQPAWTRLLHAKFLDEPRSGRSVSKTELRSEAERLVTNYLAKGGNFPGFDPILQLPAGRAWGYDGDGGWKAATYHPQSKKSGYIVVKRSPGASGDKVWPVPAFSETAWLRGNQPWARGAGRRPSKYVPYQGPVITGTDIPRAYCSNKPLIPQQEPDEAIDALRDGHIVKMPQGDDANQQGDALCQIDEDLHDLAVVDREFLCLERSN